MGDRRPYSEVEAERAKYPLGKPAPYNPRHKAPDYRPFGPNQISYGQRVTYILLSVFLLAYGIHGLIVDDLYIPGRHSRGMHLHGRAAVWMFVAMCYFVVMMLTVVVDHYDTRDNECSYRTFADFSKYLGMFFVAGAFVVGVIDGGRG